MTLWADNVTLEVHFGFGSGPLAASPSFTELVALDEVRAVTITRGRSSTRGAFTPGFASIVLDNRDGEFDPNNTSSTYAGDLNPGTPVRIRAVYNVTTYDVFYGHVKRWPVSYTLPSESTVTVEVTESLALITNYHLEDHAEAEESTDTRIGNLLDEVGWPAARRNLDTGVATVAAASGYTGDAGDLLNQAVEAEQGTFFIADDGKATFYNRIQYSSASSAATFGPSNLTYSNPTFSYDDDYLINNAAVTGADDDTQEATDSTSIATYGPSASNIGTITNDSIVNGAHALNVAEWLIGKYKDIVVRIASIQIHPEKDAANLYPQVLGLDLGSVIRVIYSPPSGDDIDQTCKIERVKHQLRPGSWVTTYEVYPLSTFETTDYWVLGTSTLGTGTVLA